MKIRHVLKARLGCSRSLTAREGQDVLALLAYGVGLASMVGSEVRGSGGDVITQ